KAAERSQGVQSKSQQNAPMPLFALTPPRAVPYTTSRISRQGEGRDAPSYVLCRGRGGRGRRRGNRARRADQGSAVLRQRHEQVRRVCREEASTSDEDAGYSRSFHTGDAPSVGREALSNSESGRSTPKRRLLTTISLAPPLCLSCIFTLVATGWPSMVVTSWKVSTFQSCPAGS